MARRFSACEETDRIRQRLKPADFLEMSGAAAPFQNGLQNCSFPQTLSAAVSAFINGGFLAAEGKRSVEGDFFRTFLDGEHPPSLARIELSSYFLLLKV